MCGIETFSFLGEVADLGGYSWNHFTRIWFDIAVEKIEESRLTNTVFSNNTDSVFLLENVRKIVNQFFLTIAFTDVVEFHYFSSLPALSNIKFKAIFL